MIKVVCDRCGKQIEGVFCRIKFEWDSLGMGVADLLYRGSDCLSASNFAAKPVKERINRNPTYCQECVDEIRTFIAGGGKE